MKLGKIMSIAIVIAVILMPNIKVFAASVCPTGMSDNDCDALTNNWPAWIPDDGSSTPCSGAAGSVTLTGNDNIAKIYNFFIAQGLTSQATAGIMGNMQAESHFDPSIEQTTGAWEDNSNDYGHAVGLVQWDGGRRVAVVRFLGTQGITGPELHQATDKLLGAELQYVMTELNGPYKSTLDAIKAATTASQAAFIFHQKYEGSNDGPDRIQGRANNAEAILQKMGGSSTSSSTAPSTSSCSDGSNFGGSNFIEYKQCNYDDKSVPWANAPYGSSNVCDSGCGPSAMAMIITNLTGQKVTPDVVAAYGAANGTAMPGGGSYWTLPQVVGSHWGLKSTELGASIEKINQTLQAGGLVLATGTGPNPFTTAGHFIVIRGLTSDGKWMTGNSAGYDSSKPYDPNAVITSLRNSWSLTK